MDCDIPLLFLPDVSLREVMRTIRDLEDMDVAFNTNSLETDPEVGAYIEADFPEEEWPKIRAYIENSPAVEVDEETLLEWADDPNVRVIG